MTGRPNSARPPRVAIEDWTARDVAAHVIETHRRAVAALEGTDAASVGADADLAAAWEDARGSVLVALDDPARAVRTVAGPFGHTRFEELVGQRLTSDTLVHPWDLARATGQDEHLDPRGVQATLDWLTPFADRLRSPSGFGPELAPPSGADAQTRLLCFVGRGA